MDWPTLKPYVTAGARWALGLAAGEMVKSGLVTSDQQAQFINIGGGIVVGLVALGWSWWQKTHQKKALDAASAGGIVKT